MMDFDLEQVFSILDENNEGQIQLRRFVDVASNYYSDAEQLARITKALDPENTGFINFEQFCDGIAQISSLQGLTLKEVASDLTRRSRENSLVEDSDQRSLNTHNKFDFPSLSSWPNHLQDENQDGSTTTFNEYDVETDETFHHTNNSKLQTPIIRTSNINHPTNGKKSNRNSNSNQSTSPFYGDDEEFTGIAEPNSSGYSSDIVVPRTTSQRASQILKRNSYLQPINSSDSNDHNQLHDTVDELQKTVETLNQQKQSTTERLSKIQNENTDLKSRLLSLEDRLHDLEGQHTRTIQSEQQKYLQRDRSYLQEKEILQSRINAIESELKQTHTLNGQMTKDVKELKDKLDDVDVQLHDSQNRCHTLSDDNKKLLEQLRIQHEQLETAKLTNIQLSERLANESSKSNLDRSLTRTENILKSSEVRIFDLEDQVRALKLENEKLRQENEELRERAVAEGIHEGRRLMADPNTPSYAAELEVLSKDELMSKMRDQFSINDRLREYIERMLTVIIENNPQLLEVTTSNGLSIGSMNLSSLPSNVKSNTADNQNKEPADKYCRLS